MGKFRWIMNLFYHRPCAMDDTSIHSRVRESVHEHARVATLSVAQSRQSTKVAEETERVAEEVIELIQSAKRRESSQ